MKHIKKFNQLNEAKAPKGPLHKDTPEMINKWWDKNYQELIDYVADLNDRDMRDLFKEGGLNKADIDAEMDGTAKHKALTVLNLLGTEYCDSLVGNDDDEPKDNKYTTAAEIGLKVRDWVDLTNGYGGAVASIAKDGKTFKFKGDKENSDIQIKRIWRINQKEVK